MKRKYVFWVLIGALFVVAIFLTFKAGDSSASIQTVQASGTALKSAASSAPPSYGGMVGGC